MWHISATPSLWRCFTPKKMKVCFLVTLKSFGPTVAIILSVLLERKRTEGNVSGSAKVHPDTTQPLDTSCVCPAEESISIFMDSLMLLCLQAVGSFIWLENYLDLGCLLNPGVQGYVAVPGVLQRALGCCSWRTRQLFYT